MSTRPSWRPTHAGDAEGAAEIVRRHCQPMLSLLRHDLAEASQVAGCPGRRHRADTLTPFLS